MPYREVGMVKNATKEAVLGVDTKGNEVELRLHVTAAYAQVKIALVSGEQILFSEIIAVSPFLPYLRTFTLQETAGLQEFEVVVIQMDTQKQLVSYRTEKAIEREMPAPAQAAKLPAEVENNEQLFLTGLHLEQYRHATFSPADYYREALRRDEKDIRCNNAMGLWLLRRGQFMQSAPYFRKAIATLTQRNPNPYDGEAFYNLGWCLKMQGQADEAFDLFYKAVWNDAWQQAGYLNLAALACGKGDFEEALVFINKSLLRNDHSHTARFIKAVVLRKLGKAVEAMALLRDSLEIDPFNYGCLYEQYKWYKAEKEEELAASAMSCLQDRSRNWVHNFIEYAFDYAHAGLYREAMDFLQVHIDHAVVQYPMVFYYMGWFAFKAGDHKLAGHYFSEAARLNPDYCFPNRIEDVPVLTAALSINPDDAKALYYLGNFWYDKRQYAEAIQCWERAAVADPLFPTVLRNLSLACYNKLQDPEKALAYMERAFQSDPADARILMELDQLYRKLNRPHRQRLDLLESHLSLVESRDDLYLERISLYNLSGDYQAAHELIRKYKFHPWEGGEGKVVGQYLFACIELAKEALAKGAGAQALQWLEAAETYPENLGEGKLYGVQENDIYYLKALACELSGDTSASIAFLEKATEGISTPVQAIFYNDPQPDKIFYQGLAWAKLGNTEKAVAIFNTLIRFGEEHFNDNITIDYFAVSLPDLLVFDADLNERNRIHCLYLQGLGYLGLGTAYGEKAKACFAEVLKLDINHAGAVVHQKMVDVIVYL
jgi:tetratricopeptide (TPR) repeat protein